MIADRRVESYAATTSASNLYPTLYFIAYNEIKALLRNAGGVKEWTADDQA
jgi:hypothetical protein